MDRVPEPDRIEWGQVRRPVTQRDIEHRLVTERYQHDFAAKFATYAPVAWTQLGELLPLATRLVAVEMESDRTGLPSAPHATVGDDLNRHVLSWAEAYQLESRWLVALAAHTLFMVAWSQTLNLPVPTTLCPLLIPHRQYESPEDLTVVWYGVTDRTLVSEGAEVEIPGFEVPRMTWDPVRQSLARFKAYQMELIKKQLDQHLNPFEEFEVDQPPMSFQWSEWCIAAHANIGTTGRPVTRQLARQFGVTWDGYRKGVRRLDAILGFPPVYPK